MRWAACMNIPLLLPFFCRRRTKSGQIEESAAEEPAVDDYLNQGIAAFSIDRLKQEHCGTFLMRFKNPIFEKQVS